MFFQNLIKIKDIMLIDNYYRKFFLLLILLLITSFFEIISIFVLEPIFSYFSDTNYKIENNYIFNVFENENRFSHLQIYFLFVLIIFFSKFIFSFILLFYQTSYIFDFKKFLSQKSSEYFSKQKIEKQLEINSSDKVRVSVNEVQYFIDTVAIPISVFFVEIIISLSLIFYAVTISPYFFFITLVFCSLVFFLFKKMRKILPSLGTERLKLDLKRQNLITQIFSSFREIKVLNKEDEFLGLFYKLTNKSANIEKKFFIIDQSPRIILEFFIIIIFSSIIFISDYLFESDIQKLLPKFAIYLVIFLRILPSINRLNRSVNAIRYSDKIIEVFYKIMKANNSKPSDARSLKKFTKFNKSIYFENIKYSYKGKLINLKKKIFIKQGSVILITGKSGSGKSTFLNILSGLVNPSHGTIKIDNVILKNSKKQINFKISYILQSSFIYDDTIKNNIIVFRKNEKFNKKLFSSCLFLSELSTDIKKLKKKQNTIIGEGGAKFSGGQKQRLLIARALYNQPNILIMDESTSNIDKKTELKIYKNLKKYKNKNLTIIVVSHSFLNKTYFDQIIKF